MTARSDGLPGIRTVTDDTGYEHESGVKRAAIRAELGLGANDFVVGIPPGPVDTAARMGD